MHKITRFILFSIAALVLTSAVVAALLPVKLVWSGDGVARVTSNGKTADYSTAVIGTRTRTFFGLRERFSYNVQEIDFEGGRYVRFAGCFIRNETPGDCLATDSSMYTIQIIKKPAYDQFSDDDGVDVGN